MWPPRSGRIASWSARRPPPPPAPPSLPPRRAGVGREGEEMPIVEQMPQNCTSNQGAGWGRAEGGRSGRRGIKGEMPVALSRKSSFAKFPAQCHSASLLRERHDVCTRHKTSPGDQEGEGSDWWLPVHFGAALPEGAQRGVRRPGQDSSRLDKTTWLHAKKTCFLCFLAFPCFTRYNSI